MAKDYYKTLGVRRDASPAEIQKAYRDLARKYHPDLNPNDKTAKEKFQKVQAAFDVLNDPSKRELYDRYGSSFEQMGAGRPREGYPGGARPAAGGEDVDFTTLFGERFGGNQGAGFEDLFRHFTRASGAEPEPRVRRGRPAERGADILQEVTIPFQVATLGGQVEMAVHRPTGKVETISVKIPAGIEEGKKIRLRGQGRPAARGGQPGDLLITIHIEEHPYFQRRGNQLHVKVPLTLAEAALGARVEIPTPRGTVRLRVPPGTSAGTRLRIKGQGVATGGTTGDLLAEVQIVLPKELDPESLEWIKKIDQRHPLNPRAELRW